MDKAITLKPRISEKAYASSQVHNTYVFVVDADASKASVAAAVTKQFTVTVTNIRVVNVKGKNKRSYNGRGRFYAGQRSDFKKAYVTLKAGDSIPVFASEDTAEQPVKAKKEKK